MNETHDPARSSFVESANAPGTDFPIQNLPFAVLKARGAAGGFHPATAIGDYALDLSALSAAGVADSAALQLCAARDLQPLMTAGPSAWSELRHTLSALLADDSPARDAVSACLLPLDAVTYALPCSIGDYTDFYTSIHHATNIGRLFRPDNPLLPNYRYVPIGYHGRSSSIGVSGQRFHRPSGQLKAPDAASPVMAPCERLDYELEVGIVIGCENPLGEPVAMDDAEAHVFGLCLLNDWSARDIQAWEYQPLGPFLAKSFATTLSPWIVTMDALAPFRAPFTRAPDEPAPLPYLTSARNDASGHVDMALEVWLQTERMRAAGEPATRVSQSNYTDAYWSVAQLVAHHTSNGCNLKPGDLFGSGTLSGATPGSEGALIELTKGGTEPLVLPNGETRRFLADGDTVTLRAACSRDGHVRIGFGEATGTVLPPRPEGTSR